MFRLWVFIAQLVGIALAFTFVMRGVVPYPLDVLLGFVGAVLVVFAMSLFREAASVRRDIRLVKSEGSASPPKDGERIAIVGKIKAQGLPLRAPFTRRECIYYRYAAVAEEKDPAGRDVLSGDYSGLAMTRCLVRDRTRELRLVGMPMFEGFDEFALSIPQGDCRENAERYVAETRFEILSMENAAAMSRSLHVTFDDREGRVRRDVRIEAAGQIGDMVLQETIVPVDVEVCAIGNWSTEQAGLVQLLGTRDLLMVHGGGAGVTVERLTARLRRHLLNGLTSGLAACAIAAWGILARL